MIVSNPLTVRFTLNGREQSIEVEPSAVLVDILREKFGLTGTKITCDQAVCGACTVLVDGRPTASCSEFAFMVEGRSVTTIEGLGSPDTLHPIQAAFIEAGALQCGFCTPGMIMTSKQLLERNPHPTEQEIRHGIEGNLCRCTGYQHIVNAVKTAAAKGGA